MEVRGAGGGRKQQDEGVRGAFPVLLLAALSNHGLKLRVRGQGTGRGGPVPMASMAPHENPKLLHELRFH